MKKIYLLLVLTGLLSACKDDALLRNGDNDVPGGPVTLDFSVTIPDIQSVQTRGLLDETAGADLGDLLPYIFIYEDTGNPESNYLRSLVYGSNITGGDTTEDPLHSSDGVDAKLKNFSATVDGTAENAIIHLVLIHEKEKDRFEYQLAQMTDRSEIGMFTGATGLLTMSAAYWSRIPLGMPINSANKVKVKEKLNHIMMVRNFAQVTVEVKKDSDAENNFRVLGFVILNGMDCGYVAAYNENTSGDKFINFVGKDYEQITKDVNYLPIRHPYALRNNADNNLDGWLDAATSELKNGETWNLDPKYMFERPIQETRMTCVLLKGEYTEPGSENWRVGYYKLDIGAYDNNEEHNPNNEEKFKGDYIGYGVYEMYHLIRNISYDIKITDAASAGHTSAESAIAGPPANNLTASVQTRNVLTMGDGVDQIGVTVYTGAEYKDKVDGTTVVIVDQEVKDENGRTVLDEEGNPKLVPYPAQALLTWFYKDGENYNPAEYLSDINYSHTGYELKAGGEGVGIIKSIDELSGNNIGWESQGDNWYGCHLHFNTPTDIPQREVVRLYNPFGLSRDVTFVLRKRWEFVTDDKYKSNIEVYPGAYSFDTNTMPSEKLDEVRRLIPGPGDVGSSRGAQLTVMFELPSDIPQELFPLEFKIGFDRQNVENAYTGNAVVVYGESLFNDDEVHYAPDVPRMQFVKTVTWDYYNGSGDYNDSGHKIVTARFQTTTDVLDNNEVGEESITRVRVYNPYFILGEDDFTRDAKNVDPDPNQTMWLWYFGDPGWQKYFTDNPTHGADTYNELWFNSHKVGAQYGSYIGMTYGRNPNSPDSPDFRFDPNATAPEGGYDATLTVTATSQYFRRYSPGIVGIGSYDNYYRRKLYAQIYVETTDGSGRYILDGNITAANKENTSASAYQNAVYLGEISFKEGRGNIFETYEQMGMPGDRYVTFRLNEGETVKRVTLWTERVGSDTENATYTWALYYSIRFELTPPPPPTN